ncbi:MAG: hypothetical protein WEB88_07330 [Gemmatimonadota bacterium]
MRQRAPSIRRAATVLAACLLTACGAADVLPGETAVTDSAGVRLVHSAAPRHALDAAPRLSAEPELVIGVREGDPVYQFSGLRGSRLREDGGVVVIDASRQIRYFDRAGRHVRTVGGQGSGPGEFRGPLGLMTLPGDSLMVSDFQLRRATVLDPEGTVLEVFPLPRVGLPPPQLVDVLPDGRLLHSVTDRPEGWPTGVVETTYIYTAVAPGRAAVDTLFVRGRPAMFGVGNGMISLPYARGFSARVDGETLLVADGQAGAVERISLDGLVLARYSWAASRLPVTESMKDAHRQQRAPSVARMTGGSAEGVLDDLPFPDSLPAFDSMRPDRGSGRIWLRRFVVDATPHVWTVLDTDGSWLADVEMPPGFSLSDILDGRIVGVWWDEFDVPYVHVYALHGLAAP